MKKFSLLAGKAAFVAITRVSSEESHAANRQKIEDKIKITAVNDNIFLIRNSPFFTVKYICIIYQNYCLCNILKVKFSNMSQNVNYLKIINGNYIRIISDIFVYCKLFQYYVDKRIFFVYNTFTTA